MPQLNLSGEDLFQSQVCRVLEFVQLPYFSIPNGSYKGWREAAKFKATGLKSGVPDLFIPRAYYPANSLIVRHGLFLELKNGKKGRVETNQTDWHEILLKEGYGVRVLRFMPDLYKAIYECYPSSASRIRGIEKLI